jgi:uncharacterized protein YsxB (DUF464 family)
MIIARMSWARLRLEVKGHAQYGTAGNDIVCAGASTLVYALAEALRVAEERGRTEADIEDKDGKIVIWAEPSIYNLGEIKAYFRMCVRGLQMLKNQYPRNIDIKEV